jgi:hypothetical protein
MRIFTQFFLEGDRQEAKRQVLIFYSVDTVKIVRWSNSGAGFWKRNEQTKFGIFHRGIITEGSSVGRTRIQPGVKSPRVQCFAYAACVRQLPGGRPGRASSVSPMKSFCGAEFP